MTIANVKDRFRINCSPIICKKSSMGIKCVETLDRGTKTFFSMLTNCHDSFRTYLICLPLNIHERIGYWTRKVLTGKLNRFQGIFY